jgi:hypothetical protein
MPGNTEEGAPVEGALEFEITPESGFFALDDQRADDEAFELQAALTHELPNESRTRPDPKKKGVVTDVIVPLASSGALTAMVEVFKAWLAKRPDHRTIRLKYKIKQEGKPEREGNLSIDATNVDDAVLGTLSGKALQQGE